MGFYQDWVSTSIIVLARSLTLRMRRWAGGGKVFVEQIGHTPD
jgi:hypothetical protein